MIIPDARHASRAVPSALAVAAAVLGAIVAWHYHRLGLTLTHYDARGHLVVARRIIDSLTPGWQQIGAIWLPFPHLLNAVPAQIDLFYRTGASAVAISVAAFAVATGAIAWIVLALTESAAAALAAAAVFALNPNVLYLQSTPMTEPLLLALTTLAIAMLVSVVGAELAPTAAAAPPGAGSEAPVALAGAHARARRVGMGSPRANEKAERRRIAGAGSRHKVGMVFALACLTRYEAWPATAAALAAAAWARWRGGARFAEACRLAASIALYPALAIAGFTIFSRVVIGRWFVGSDFFVPENKALGDGMLALGEIGWGTQMLSGPILLVAGGAGAAALALRPLLSRRRARDIVPLALVGMAAIPWAAFVKGHPFRIRYMVPLIAIEAVGAGVLAGAFRRGRIVRALAVLALAASELRPLDTAAPMVVEAQWDRPNLAARARVTACLGRPGTGRKIMASMGSLGHYMQEASAAGFAVRDFLHEGNGDIWLASLDAPRFYADWILIEEKAEGGDLLARLARARPSFLDGYTRVCEGAGIALYKREEGTGQRAIGSDWNGTADQR